MSAALRGEKNSTSLLAAGGRGRFNLFCIRNDSWSSPSLHWDKPALAQDVDQSGHLMDFHVSIYTLQAEGGECA